jgi:3-oxoacyl-[acyl-carrier-protein] synthase II
MKRRVVVTGLGVLAPNGIGIKSFAEGIFSGKSGIGAITRFNSSDFKIKIAGEIKDFDPVDYMPIAVVRKTDRFAQLGVAAAKMALGDAALDSENSDLRTAAVIMGSGLGGSNFHEETIVAIVESGNIKKSPASAVPRISPNAVSAYIAMCNQIKGPNQVISTACSSGSQAIGEAFRRVRAGDSHIVLAGGVEAPVSMVNMAMYQAMMVLGTSTTGNDEDASRPFDKTRNGFVMAEGAACLVLEDLDHAMARGVHIHAEIVGFGSNCGAYHMVSPNPSGDDAREAMQLALADAGLAHEEVDFISAHGTSTKLNDLAETRAIKSLFGKRAYDIPVSSIKSMIGHTIGASGAIQTVASCLAVEEGRLPPTMHLKEADPECDLDYVANEGRKKQITTVVSNSFGFGSNNATLVLRRMNNGN